MIRSLSLGSAVLLVLAGPVAAEVHLMVGTAEQGGQYTTVQDAVDAVPSGNTERHVIDILPGTYTARVILPSDKPYITLRGHGATAADTVLTYYETANTPPNESTVHASTVVRGKDFIAENVTFENSYGPGAQALAIYVKADRVVFDDCRFLGYQDTLRSEYGRHYFYDSYVEGAVDFIYGRGTAFFEKTKINPVSGGYIAAQAREAEEETNGYVFKDCTIDGSASSNSVYLGRPWQPYSRAVYIDTKMSSEIKPAGWSDMSGNYDTCYFAEYNSMDLDGDPVDVSSRVSWSHQLTAAEAEAYSKANWLSGTDAWAPTIDETVYAPEDFDRNGAIDLNDLLIWQRGFGLVGQGDNFQGDATGDGVVDGNDLAAWRAAFSGASQAVTAVPEPGAMTLFGLAAAGLIHRRAR